MVTKFRVADLNNFIKYRGIRNLTEKAVERAGQIMGDKMGAAEINRLELSENSLIAVVSRSESTLEKTLERPLFTPILTSGDVRIFLESNGAIGFPRKGDGRGHAYFSDYQGLFDFLIIDESLTFVVSHWSKAFLGRFYNNLRPGGTMIVPVWNGAIEKKFGRWTANEISTFFCVNSEPIKGTHFTRFNKTESIPKIPGSVLSWYMKYSTELLLQNAVISATETELHPPAAYIMDQTDSNQLRDYQSTNYSNWIGSMASNHAYFVGGISYKAPLISHIIREHIVKEEPLRLIDMGGGYGLLAAELALDPTLKISESVCTDISTENEIMAARLYADNSESLNGRFKFLVGPAQELDFDGQFDVVSYIGSLLYVPKDQLEKTVERAWQAVAPGGLLIVHENIKHPNYKRDFNVMFEIDEIDKLLGKYGDIVRYASQYTQELTKVQAEKKTVFRVVKKALSF